MVDKADAAYQAATQIKTATQLFQVVQESIGSMWAQAFTLILGDFEQSKELWGKVGDVVLGIVDGISEKFLGALRIWSEEGGRPAIIDGFSNAFDGLLKVLKRVTRAFGQVFPDNAGSSLVSLSKAFEAFTKNLIPSKDTLFDIRRIFTGVFAVLHIGVSIISGVAKAFAAFFGALFEGTGQARGGIFELLGDIGHILKRFDMFLTEGGRLTNFLAGIGKVAGTALRPVLAVLGFLVVAIVKVVQLGAKAFAPLLDVIGAFGSAISDSVSDGVAAFAPLIDIVHMVRDAFGELGEGGSTGKLIAIVHDIRNTFLDMVDNVLAGLERITAPIEGLSGFFGGLRDSVADAKTSIGDMYSDLNSQGASIGTPLVEGIRKIKEAAADALQAVKDALADFQSVFQTGGDSASSFADSITSNVTGSVGDLGGAADRAAGFAESISSNVTGSFTDLAGAADKARDSTTGVYDNFTNSTPVAASVDNTTSIFERLMGVLSSAGNTIKTIAGFIGDALGFMFDKLSNIPFPDDALEWAAVLNTLISGALIKRLFFSKGLLGTFKDTMQEVGQSMSKTFGELGDTLKTMQNGIKAEMIRNIAIAVALLAASIAVFAYIPKEKLAQGVGGMVFTFTALAAMLLTISKINAKLKFSVIAAGLVAMASAVAILVAAVAAMGYLPIEVLQQGLTGMAAVMTGLVAAMIAMSGVGGKLASAGAAMVLAATAINIIVLAILALGKIPIEVLQQGLTGLAAGLTILTVSMLLLSGIAGRIIGAGAAMVLMAVALDLVIGAIIGLGSIELETMTQGLDGLQRVLLLMTISLLALSVAGPAVMGAGAAMLMLSGALLVLAGVIGFLGALPMEVISRGLYALAAGLAVLLISALLAMSVLPGLAALTAIISAIGVAMLATGAGFFLFATGLALIAAVGTAAFAVITVAIGAFIALLPSIAVQMAAAFVSFLQAIALAAPKIRKAMAVIMINLLQTVEDTIPKLMKVFGLLIEAGLTVVATYIARYVLLGVAIVLAILEGLAENIPKMIDAAYDIAYAFIDGMGKRATDLANAGADAFIEMLNGLTEAIETKGPQIRQAMKDFAAALAAELKAAWDDFAPDLSMPDIHLPKFLGGEGNGRLKLDPLEIGGYEVKAKADPLVEALEATGIQVALAIDGAVRLMVGALSGPLYDLATSSKASRFAANKNTVVATERETAAATAEETASSMLSDAQGMKKGKKGTPAAKKRAKAIQRAEEAAKKARAQRKLADAAARKAAEQQIKADYEEAQSRDAIQYKDDPAGLGDAKSQLGQDLADQSASLQASAEAKAAEAKRLTELAKTDKKNAKKYMDQARQLRKDAASETAQAMQLSVQAIDAQTAAVNAYAAARRLAAQDAVAAMADIREQQRLEEEQRAWEKQFASVADTSADPNEVTKETMLNARIKETQAKATAAQDELGRQLAIGEALAAKLAADPNYAPTEDELLAAEKAAAEAAKQAAIVTASLDAVAQDQQALEQLVSSVSSNNTSTGGNNNNLTPSRTAMEDAAKAVDRYTSSVQQAEAMAGAGESTTQFIQNNYSPEALSASDIYRQSKNLISAAEVKMAV